MSSKMKRQHKSTVKKQNKKMSHCVTNLAKVTCAHREDSDQLRSDQRLGECLDYSLNAIKRTNQSFSYRARNLFPTRSGLVIPSTIFINSILLYPKVELNCKLKHMLNPVK